MSNNAKGNKQVICFWYSFVLWWFWFLSCKHCFIAHSSINECT